VVVWGEVVGVVLCEGGLGWRVVYFHWLSRDE
jgi:hypothetical protein